MEQTEQYRKYGGYVLLALLIAGGFNPVKNFVVNIAMTGLTMVALGLSIVGGVILLPAITEAIANFSFGLVEWSIRKLPLARLRRDLKAYEKKIDLIEAKIREADAASGEFDALFKEKRGTLSPARLTEWETKSDFLKRSRADLVGLRDEEVRKLHKFEEIVGEAEVDYGLGKAFGSALEAFQVAKKVGVETQGSRIALSEIRKDLNSSMSQLDLVLSRPKRPSEIQAANVAQLSS